MSRPPIYQQDNDRMEFLLTLRRRGIADKAVLRAMDEVPRERFVDANFVESAYADQALPIECGQTISQPYVVAYMTERLGVQSHHRVLEIGTGSGYQAAVLCLPVLCLRRSGSTGPSQQPRWKPRRMRTEALVATSRT